MSYNDQYNEGGSRQGYSGGNDTYGGNQGGYGGGDERRHGGNDNYGGNQGGYGGEERRQGDNQEERYGSGEGRHGNQGGNFGVTGGSEYNTGGGAGYGNQSGGGYNNNQSQSGGYPSGPQGQGGNEFGGALQHAQQQSGGGSEPSLFSNALGFLSNNKQDIKSSAPDFDERQATHAHEAVYGQGDNQQHDSQTLGMSAAIQAMQKFTGGGAPQQPPPQKEGGGLGGMISGMMGKEKHEQPPPQPAGLGGMISSMMGGNQGSQQGQNQFIGLAMKEAAELFNKQEAQGSVVSSPELLIRVTYPSGTSLLTHLRTGARHRQAIRRQLRRGDGNEILHEAADGLVWRTGRYGLEVHVGNPAIASCITLRHVRGVGL